MRTNDPTSILGWGVDRYPQSRPGVPMEETPHPAPHAHWAEPEQQQRAPGVEVLHHAGRKDLTPVFGTEVPPRGLSGVLRRVAYRIPEHKPRHWELLLLADRVDVVEGLLEDARVGLAGPKAWVGLGAGTVAAVAAMLGLRHMLKTAR